MRILTFFLCSLSFCSCTTIYENGKKVCSISSNVTGVTFRTPTGTVFVAQQIDNAIIHKEIGTEITKGILGIGSSVATSGIIK